MQLQNNTKKNNAYLSLGSNKGDRSAQLRTAVALISDRCGNITALSQVYETAAWGINEQPGFLNMVLQLETQYPPTELLSLILEIEITMGRVRMVKWGERLIDIDILLYNSIVVHLPGLEIPHPFLHLRRFVLTPLAEIASSVIHPSLHLSVKDLLLNCPDDLHVQPTGGL